MRIVMITTCDKCGKEIKVYGRKAQALSHHFCSRSCSHDYTSQRMTEMNQRMNPERMTEETREKLRNSRLGMGKGVTYSKTYGRHTHRVVAEQMLGRPLKEGEVVHHIDGNKRNNEPSNLMVFPSAAEHSRYHKLHPIK